jgi:tRNA pseudouridine38-40 synthase
MKIKLILSYNGSTFEGSQVQKHTNNTVMGRLYEAFESINIKTKLHASGRTDAGVHASKQTMHCEVPAFWSDLDKLKEHLQYKLPSSIHIRHLTQADEEFHARYSAKRRMYRYILCDKQSNPFESAFVTFTRTRLDIKALQEAMLLIEGEHDFGMFKKSGGASGSDVRTIFKTRVYPYRNKTILYFEANGFLRSQIRLMVSLLLKISEGKLTNEQLLEQLNNEKNHNTRPAPPNGLYLSNIIY